MAGLTDLAEAPGSGVPRADVLIFRLAGGRVVLRPSGTEPKIKCYVEITEPVAGRSLAAAREAAAARLAPLRAALEALLAAAAERPDGRGARVSVGLGAAKADSMAEQAADCPETLRHSLRDISALGLRSKDRDHRRVVDGQRFRSAGPARLPPSCARRGSEEFWCSRSSDMLQVR